MTMAAPTLNPSERPQNDIAPADSYPIGAPVWVHRGGGWRAGRVLESSPLATMVRYRPTDGPGTAVDTVNAANLLDRADVDQVDHPVTQQSGAVVRRHGQGEVHIPPR